MKKKIGRPKGSINSPEVIKRAGEANSKTAKLRRGKEASGADMASSSGFEMGDCSMDACGHRVHPRRYRWDSGWSGQGNDFW